MTIGAKSLFQVMINFCYLEDENEVKRNKILTNKSWCPNEKLLLHFVTLEKVISKIDQSGFDFQLNIE